MQCCARTSRRQRINAQCCHRACYGRRPRSLETRQKQRLSSKEGQTTDRHTPILDPKAYQVAFDKIGDAIFVRSATR